MHLLVVGSDPQWRRNVQEAVYAWDRSSQVTEATTPAEALSLGPTPPFDLILVELATPSPQPVEGVWELRLRLPRTPLVVCSPRDPRYLLSAVALGASAWLSKETPLEFLVSLFLRIKGGEHPIQYDLVGQSEAVGELLRWFREHPLALFPSPPPVPLSPRERRVLSYVARGYSNKEIGQRLGVKEQTIKNRVSLILRKIQARDRAHAAVLALTRGWITLAPDEGEALPLLLPGGELAAPPRQGRRGSRPPLGS